MPRARRERTDDPERIVQELRMLSPIPLTRLDLSEELRLPYRHTSRLLDRLEREGRLRLKPGFKKTQAKLYYVPEES